MWINKHLKINSFKNHTHPRRIQFYHPLEYSRGWAQWYESHSERREVPGVRVETRTTCSLPGTLGDCRSTPGSALYWVNSQSDHLSMAPCKRAECGSGGSHPLFHPSFSILGVWTPFQDGLDQRWMNQFETHDQMKLTGHSEYVVHNACCVCIKITFQRASEVLGSCFHLRDSVESLR